MVMDFACFGDFVSRSAFGFRQITPADFNTSQSVLTFGLPHLKIHSYGPDRYINDIICLYMPVNC